MNNIKNKIEAVCKKTKTANEAPIGSIIIPSQRKIEDNECLSFICLNIGVTTVGPETINIAPNKIDNLKSNCNNQNADPLISTQVIRAPILIKFRIGLPTNFKSEIRKLNPPSNKMMATDKEINGYKIVPIT